jgi:hypothetical protein
VSVPSAFTYTTGSRHWEVLLRARAIENQCYVVAAAQGGTHENGRRTFGHSLIVDPWGDVVACRSDDGEGIVLAECVASGSTRCASTCPLSSTGSSSDGVGASGERARRALAAGAASAQPAIFGCPVAGGIGSERQRRLPRSRSAGRLRQRRRIGGDGGRERRVSVAHGATTGTSSRRVASRRRAMLVEQNVHARSSVDATPGYGASTDYWIVRRTAAWRGRSTASRRLRPRDHARGVLARRQQVRMDRARPRAALLGPQPVRGGYVFKVADFVLTPEPHLENVRTIRPGHVEQGGEVESIAMTTDDRVLQHLVSKNLFASRIYTMDIESGAIQELTTESFAQAPTFTPDGRSIVYMTGAGPTSSRFSCKAPTGGS